MLAAVLAASGLGSAQSTHTTVRHHKVADTAEPTDLSQAEALIEKKDYAGAEPLLQRAVAADASNYTAWFDLGFVYNALGRSQDAITAYRKSVAAKPDIFESNLNLGLMLAKAGQPDAEQYLRAATKLKPTAQTDEGLERAWLSLGHVIEATKPDEALEAYKQAAALQAKDPEPHLSAAALLEKSNRYSDALEQFRQVLTIDPGSAEALTGMANVYMRGRQFAPAEEALKKLVELRPNDAGARMQLARMLAAAGENDAAIAEMQAAVKLDAQDAAAQRDLADLYRNAGKYELAEAQYKTLLDSSPNDAELHAGLGQAYLRQRKFADAQQEFTTAVTLKPDMGAAYGDLAIAANETKNYPLALKALDARAKYLPETAISYFFRATAYDHLRDYKLASENYHRFLELDKGEHYDQAWQARHRLIAIEPKK